RRSLGLFPNPSVSSRSPSKRTNTLLITPDKSHATDITPDIYRANDIHSVMLFSFLFLCDSILLTNRNGMLRNVQQQALASTEGGVVTFLRHRDIRVGTILLLGSVMLAQTARNRNAAAQPIESVRVPERHVRTTVTNLLGWSIGIPSDAFRQLTFTEAAVKTDALGLGFIEGYNTQKTSPEIEKLLNFNLSEAETKVVQDKLAALKLKMLAYHIDRMPETADTQRAVLTFAKNLGATTVVCNLEPSTLEAMDKLANEVGVNVALEAKDPKGAVKLVGTRTPRIGLSVDTGKWMEAGVKPVEAIASVNERLMTLTLRDRSALGAKGHDVPLGSGVGNVKNLLLEIAKREPAPEEQPDECSNCSRPYGGIKPLFIVINQIDAGGASQVLTSSIEGFEKNARYAMGYRVEQDSKVIPITSTARIPDEVKRGIESALPKLPLAKPQSARKLLVIDICPAGAYYHDTSAHANLAIQLMAKNTGAYEPVFSNDLNNLKYPKIKSFDAVFLNSSDGEVFADPEVMAGLGRFVREGGGLAGIHGSSFASRDVPEFGELLGATDGPHHVEKAVLKVDDPNSPIMKGFKAEPFAYVDEFYHFPPTGPYSREKLHVLLSIDAAKSDLSAWHVRPDNDYGMVWVKKEGKGRVFNCALGHTPTLFQNPAFAEMILGGIQFVLGDLQVDTTPSARLSASK
ncbi:MAG: ThuA domain-containing protein, partial [Bryobacteraceae bacterium]